LAGEVPGEVRAPAHYVHLPANGLLSAWASCVDDLQEWLKSYAGDELAQLLCQRIPEPGRMPVVIEYGSHKQYSVTEPFRQLRDRTVYCWKRAAHAITPDEQHEYLIEGTRTGCAYSYALQAISMALRASGE